MNRACMEEDETQINISHRDLRLTPYPAEKVCIRCVFLQLGDSSSQAPHGLTVSHHCGHPDHELNTCCLRVSQSPVSSHSDSLIPPPVNLIVLYSRECDIGREGERERERGTLEMLTIGVVQSHSRWTCLVVNTDGLMMCFQKI